MKAVPDKVIAGVVVGSTMKLRGELTDDHRRVPMCVINGDLEHDCIGRPFLPVRRNSAEVLGKQDRTGPIAVAIF